MPTSEVLTIILLTLAAGSCIPLGGLIASIEHIRSDWLESELRHFLIAFGGGILLGAVAVVLVPEGVSAMGHSLVSVPIVVLGGIACFGIERRLGLQKRASPQLMGMVLDYVPEAIALGGLLAQGSPIAPLLAVLIGLQNLPEGFNSFRELKEASNKSSKHTLLVMLILVPIGPLAGLAGYYLLAGNEAILGAIMLFASGGILYLLFQDIAPQSKLESHWAPPLGAVIGFGVALFSEMLVHQI